MKEKLKKNSLTVALLLVGAIGGYLYWRFIGCTSGSCGITSNPFGSTLFGGLAGYLIGDSIKDFRKKKTIHEKPVE